MTFITDIQETPPWPTGYSRQSEDTTKNVETRLRRLEVTIGDWNPVPKKNNYTCRAFQHW